MTLVLPESTVHLIDAVAISDRHPGLQLDKFSVPGDQQAQKAALERVCEVPGDDDLLSRLSERRNHLLSLLRRVVTFSCATTGPLTLHLARASALENAGLCLHPIYGFAYLPGSGLKGMARAYAETVWLPAQADQNQAWRQIENVFGWAPNPDRKRQINEPDHPAERRRVDDADPNSPEIKAHVGDVVFHDAWPESWPQMIVDIVNNHHPNYYQHDDNDHAPGDWENPVPVYFLAAKPGTSFSFPLAKRRADVADELLDLSRQWLLGALCHLGAGAKTAAGYGAFKPADAQAPALPTESRAVFKTTLELVTPAFLAGANQQAEDCDLRSATLRGLLRWWWRTMHAGFLDVKTLRALEAAIWGDTQSGGAVRIVVERAAPNAPQPYDKRSKASVSDQQKVPEFGIPNADARKTTQGLWYASYGMDEGGRDNRRQRHVMEPPASWQVRLIARRSRFESSGPEFAAPQVLEQAQAALWLLCHFGGVGSKAGKGFGSLSTTELAEWSLDKVKQHAADLRRAMGLNNAFPESAAASASLEQMLGPVEATFAWPSIWSVMDQIGFAYQSFAKKYKHRLEKKALGLPRRVGKPIQGSFNPTPPVTSNSRHTSPVHIHVEPIDNGFLVRAIAFPAAHLPNLADSRTFLEEFLTHFGGDIQRRAAMQPPPSPRSQGITSSRQQSPSNSTSPHLPQVNERIQVVLLDKPTKKGGWKALHQPSGLTGPIKNSGDVPADKKAGDTIEVFLINQQPQFAYPSPEEEERVQKAQRNRRKDTKRGKPPRGRR